MPFEFSDATHKFCEQCNANIRKDASWCRFCPKNGTGKFLTQTRGGDPSELVDSAACWLPQFNDLILRCGEGLRERLREAEVAMAERVTEVDLPYLAERIAKRSANFCSERPPEPRVLEFVRDILLNLHEGGEDLEHLCEEPRLVLIDVTAESIFREAELRKSEEDAGNACAFCNEFIFADAICRFCGAVGEAPPQALDAPLAVLPLDEALLRAIVLWEAARAQVESHTTFRADVLEPHQISDEEIQREAARQLAKPASFPRSQWRSKMRDLQVQTERPMEKIEFDDLLDLGSACSFQRSNDETEIVFTHGLRRVAHHEDSQFARRRLLEGLARVAYVRKDYEKHRQLSEEAHALRLSTMPKGLRQVLVEWD